MPVLDAQLLHQHHLDGYRRMGLLAEDADDGPYWHNKAAQMQFCHVHDALRDLLMECVRLSAALPQGPAFDHLRFGAGRRLNFIWQGVRDLHEVAPADRRAPMNQLEVDRASRALNDIYIHSLGTLDNYAHGLGCLLAGDRFNSLSPMQKSLFSAKYLDCCASQPLRELVAPFEPWAMELKKLRNPVAHGIPLTIPPTIITGETQAEHAAAMADYQAELNNPPATDGQDRGDAYEAWSARVEERMGRMEAIGEFRAWISHDPRAEIVPIYPTVLDDVGQLVRICRAMNGLVVELVENQAA